MATWKALLLFAAGTSAFQSSATRKTLNFSPLIQNSHFTTSPAQGHSPFATLETRSSVVELAEAYLKRVLHLPEGTWKPREDSYQDQATQIWHLYFRQLLQEGLVEVVDGDVNLNVLNGRVISYGDSFYRGPVPSLRNPSRYDNTTYDLSHYCRQLERLGAVHRLFTGHPHAHDLTQGLFTQAGFTQSSSEEDAYRYNTYCANQHRLLDAIQARFTQTSDVDPQVSNPVDAALYFILAAHPNIAEADAIAGNLDIHRQNTVTRHIAEDNIAHDPFDKLLFESPYPNLVRLSNLPLAISSIYASLVYVQTNQLVLPNPPAPNLDPDGLDLPTNTVLPLAWKLVVELPENHYKAYIDAYVPSRILKVVDWVSDFDHHPTGELERARHPWPGDGTCSLNPPRSENVISQRGVFKDASGPATGATAYKVWPLGINDPLDGEGLREVLRSPHDTLASPLGWHSIPARHNPNWDPELPLQPTGELPDVEWAWRTGHKEGDEGETCHFVETWGNNVQAQENWEGRGKFLRNHRPDGGPDSSNLMFNYSYGASSKHDGEDIDPHAYVDLAITQLFYVINAVHDLFYRYGFTEAAGNFQSYNFGKGGKEDDAVLAYAQDGSRTNNANFVTPPDGIQGKMRVYIWTHSVPFRDASLDTGIVVHELSHGLSRRLTGGPRNSRCLGTDEGAGLSEGWGDFTAVLVWMTGAVKREEKDALDRDYTVAGWVANKTEGVRRYPYSRNMTTNPSTYRTMNEPQYWNVHQIGEVWAQMLFIVLHVLIEKHGIGDTLFPPQPHANGTFMFPNSFYDPPNVHARSHSRPILKHGNTLFFQLLVDGMKLQPCETDFFSARDAILQADENLTGGENVCDIWKGFAGRGLGPFARFKLIGPWRDRKERTNDFSVPVKCGGTGKPDDGE